MRQGATNLIPLPSPNSPRQPPGGSEETSAHTMRAEYQSWYVVLFSFGGKRYESETRYWSQKESRLTEWFTAPVRLEHRLLMHQTYGKKAEVRERTRASLFASNSGSASVIMEHIRRLERDLESERESRRRLEHQVAQLSKVLQHAEDDIDRQDERSDDYLSWCENNKPTLRQFANKFVALKLPDGIIASADTRDEVEQTLAEQSGLDISTVFIFHTSAFAA